jgi:type I restriction enzyme, S subunit
VRYPAYSLYKESGVQWLGDVPEHWEVKKLGYLASKIGSGKTPSGGATTYLDEGVMFLRSQNVYDDGLRLDDVVYIDELVDAEMQNSRVHLHDVLLNITGASLGRTCIVPEPFPRANVNQHVCIIRQNDTNRSAFVSWVLKSAVVKAQITSSQTGSGREGLNFEQISKFLITLPPQAEQTAIADFLDRETGRIDTLVAKKRRLIALLKEKRTALISRTVTRGLPEDAAREFGLESHTRFKDSGIEWLGLIPEGWEIVKFSREVKIAEGQVDPEREPYSSMILIGPEHVEAGTGRLVSEATAEDQAAISGKYFCCKGDVIYSKIRPALRKVVKAKYDCLCSADMYPLRGIDKLLNDYVYWLSL